MHKLALYIFLFSASAFPALAQNTLPFFGVLNAQPTYLESNKTAGINAVEIDMGWDAYEPVQGKYNETYRNQIQQAIQQYHANGFKVIIGVGLQYPPGWIKSNSSLLYQSQFTGQNSGVADFTFNGSVRELAATYINEVITHIGSVDYYRVGLSKSGEALYPEAPNNEWWAFSPMAQGDIPGRPSEIPNPPLSHWVPGTLYQDKPVSENDTRKWHDWYLNALIDAHDWEIKTFRHSGYKGPLMLVMPGSGVNPDYYEHSIHTGLANNPKDIYHVMNTGSAWFLFLNRLKHKDNVVLDISSIYDQSGKPVGNECQPDDDKLNVTAAGNSNWSSARWLAYLARRNGLDVVGENPGNNSNEDMRHVFTLARSCNLKGILWAFDSQLHGGQYATAQQYGSLIQQFYPKQ